MNGLPLANASILAKDKPSCLEDKIMISTDFKRLGTVKWDKTARIFNKIGIKSINYLLN
jgi:hypothetical protein